jgi:Protein of unknown function (DUF402)
MTERWRAGDAVIVRTVHENGRVGMVLPTTVVQDRDDLVALYVAPETLCKRRVGKRGGPRGRLLIEDTGRHEDWTWDGNRRLILWRPHAMHAVSLFWRGADDTFLGWYVDILLPFRRSSLGFDTRDLDLDVVIDPDRAWRLKDEDELEWSRQEGLITSHEAKSIRAEAERAVALLEANDPLFSDDWTAWRPDPTWHIPAVPKGWIMVPY